MSASQFAYITAALYWVLIGAWLIILIFYWREYRRITRLSPMVGTMLVVVFLDGARTLLENIYFGTGYTALTGLIPRTLFDTLVTEPQNVLAPKLLNLCSAMVIIGVMIRQWFPQLKADIEHRKERERLYVELTQAHEELKSAQEARDALSHMIVHDMRTPLTNVITGLQTVQTLEETSELGDELVGGALTGANRLLGMVNDLLDVSKIESGEMTLQCEKFPIRDVLHEASESVTALLRERELGFKIDPEGELEDFLVYADREKVRRIVVNLLGNAIKFSPDGSEICVSLARKPSNIVEISVIDHGPGIAKEHQERIFDKFYQVAGNGRKTGPSTGLGLTFCKLAVEAQGGHIGIVSEPGEGSRFWFTLPTEPPPIPAIPNE